MHRRIMAIVFLFALISLGFSSPVLVRFFGTDGRLVDSREFPDGAVAIPSEWADGVVRIYSLPDTVLLATISVDPEHCGYADQSGWASVAATAIRTLGTTWADSCDSANWADQSGHSLTSDSAQFAVFADSARTATSADSARISAFADSTRTSAYADSAGAAALAYNLVPGDGDYIQNQSSASQPASFWISGAGWIGDSLRVDGNVNIGGKLTVAGGIDPTYLALTPQSAAPGVDFALWVDATDSALVYFDGTSSVHLITATDTVVISLFADSARVAAYADSAVFSVYSDTALYVAGSSVVGRVDSAVFADTAFYVNIAVYADTALFVARAESSVYSDTASFALSADSATYADTASYVDTAIYADTALYVAWAESSIYSDTASFAVNADSAGYSVYSDTAFYVNTATYADTALYVDTAVYADTCLNCPRADSAVYADTALYIAGSAVAGRVDSATYADTASYVDRAIYADTAFFVARAETSTCSDTAFYIAGANVLGKVDSAQFADTVLAKIDSALYSDTALYVAGGNVIGKVDSAQFADTVLGKIDSSLYSDTAAVAGDLLPGDADYIQNLTPDGVGATGQTADFDITGNGEIGGDLHIYGDLTVDGKIDPTYLALTPQVSDPAPAVAGKLWVDAGNNLVYNQSAGTSLIVVATSTGQVDASNLSANSVDSSHIIDGSVGSADINWGTSAGQVDAADVPYSPAMLSDWGGVDPQYVNVALDTLAARVNSLGSGGLHDLTDGRGIRTFVYNGGAAETVEVDLFAGGGLEFTGSDSAIAVEVGDFAGNGLAGSDRNLYVDVAASGALTNTGGIGTQLAVLVDGATIGINGSNQLEVIDLPAGDADYIQNQNSAAQSASFWISGAGRIGDTLRVDGNVNIGGKLTVNGGIDPTYMAFTQQTSDPAAGTTGKLWVDAGGNLQYSTASGNEAVVTSGNIGTYGVTSINAMTGAIPFNAGLGLSVAAAAGQVTYSLSASLNDLTDVNTTGVADGQVIKWSAALSQWVPANDSVDDADNVVGNEYNTSLSFNDGTNTLSLTDGGGTLTATINNEADDLSDNSINDLSDVDTTGAVNGQVLTWNGSAWVPQDVPGDDWGTQVVQTAATLTGDGTSANPLDIAAGAITSSHIQDGTITSADIQDGTITGTDIQDGTITTDDIQDGTITGNDINSSTNVTVQNLTANTRVSANVAVNLPIYSGANSTPTISGSDGDMIIWEDTSSGHDFKICVYVGESYGSGHWECTDVN